MNIDRFLAKPKKYIIGGEELEIRPLTINSIDLFMKMFGADIDAKAKATKELFVLTFKQTFPEAKAEDIENISIEFFKEFSDAILDVNNLAEKK